ncbi:DNA polymerase III subunit delta [Prolixibacteraceae bacterium Z1-6]|uniref:DNA polymerase III subunit delta n=1 Tax=Draconibacterium aestuarii TaxID=2998507 RepID=A0A9X3J5M3_9BACT|nr:DNA polymerase III subunit delta [Prolixibacteraceae bacterium Z1-6]
MFFKDVVGQDEIKKRLIRSVQEERISHAQLFSGHSGTGKLPMALAYAQYISCKNRSDEDSCGVCPSCHKYQKLAHPDLHFVFPIFNAKQFNKPVSDDFLPKWRTMVSANPYFELSQWLSHIDAGNAQGEIYERESESILRKLNLKSFEAEFKVMIIWLPEKMNQACSNKLLKMIEEPPSKTLFLLITENEEGVIGTIRSRAQLVKFPFINNTALEQALLKLEGVDPAIVPDAVHLAAGSYIKALEYLTPGDDEQFYFQKFQEMMRFAYARKVSELIVWADEMAKIGRDKQKAYFAAALRLVREYFVSNLKRSEITYMNLDEKEWAKKFAPFINERNIVAFADEFELAIKHISMNGNPRIIFMDTGLRMVRLIKR